MTITSLDAPSYPCTDWVSYNCVSVTGLTKLASTTLGVGPNIGWLRVMKARNVVGQCSNSAPLYVNAVGDVNCIVPVDVIVDDCAISM